MTLHAFRLDYLDLTSTLRTPYRPGLDRLGSAVARRSGGGRLECATTWWPAGLNAKLAYFTANPFNSTFL